MKRLTTHRLAISALASFLAVGIPYWSIPYARLNLPGALLGPGLLVIAISALLLRGLRIVSFWRATGVVGASAAAAVMARVLVDGVRDPTSHNLWPFEVIIAAGMGLACAACGAIAGSLLAPLFPAARKRP